MSLLFRLIRKLFLVKEIISKYGNVHFRRYRLIQTPWFALYIHQILKSDEDADMHDHPWSFQSLILSGSYKESCKFAPNFDSVIHSVFNVGDVIKHEAEDAHRITIQTPEVWTLVFTSGRTRYWGYQTPSGWIGHKEYRQLKNEGKLP
jgi:hypothetical protein